MRTTLTLEDDVYVVARELAEELDTTLGKAVSILVRRGFRQDADPVRYIKGFEPFRCRPDGPIVTIGFVNDLLDETS